MQQQPREAEPLLLARGQDLVPDRGFSQALCQAAEADPLEVAQADLDRGQVEEVDGAVLELGRARRGLVPLALDERGDDRAAREPRALELRQRLAAGEQLACVLDEKEEIAGVSIVEIAVGLAIVALLLGSTMYTLSAHLEQRDESRTLRTLDDARDLLLAFAIVNARLPCPARDPSGGDELRDTGGVCRDAAGSDEYYRGLLPARALGFHEVDAQGFARDAWGNRIRYAVAKSVIGCAGSPKLPHFTSADPAWQRSLRFPRAAGAGKGNPRRRAGREQGAPARSD